MKKLTLIIFDLDDTLVHSSIDYNLMRIEVSNLFVPPLARELVNRPVVSLLEDLKSIHPEKVAVAMSRLQSIEEHSSAQLKIVEGADLLPRLLNNKIRAAVLTNNSKASVERYLERPGFEFLKSFHIVTRDDAAMKPDPSGILRIMADFGASAPETICIGDSYIDSEAAHRAGVRFVWFDSRGLDPATFRNPPMARMTRWSDFPATLSRLEYDCII